VYGLDTSIPQPPAHGRIASSGQGGDSEASELLCHHGQLRALRAVWASDTSGAVQMAQSAEPTQGVYLGGLPTGHEACGMAPGASASHPEPVCPAVWLNEEPDVGNLLVRFCEGLRHNWGMAEIMGPRRETRRQTENPNVMPVTLEGLILLGPTRTHCLSRIYLTASALLSPLSRPTPIPDTSHQKQCHYQVKGNGLLRPLATQEGLEPQSIRTRERLGGLLQY